MSSSLTTWLLLLAVTIGGCSASGVNTDTRQAGPAGATQISPETCAALASADAGAEDESSYRIQPGDVLGIRFYMSPELDDEPTVRPDGKITAREVGDVVAAGRTPAQLATALDQAYSTELKAPEATVHVKATPSRQVYVDGQVSHPGTFKLEPQMSAIQAIAQAGGVTEDAAPTAALLIRRDHCGRPSGIGFDLARAEKQPESDQDVRLLPGDIIYVPRSKISEMGLFVKHYVKDLMPVQPYLPIF
jgi:protein involved in polysaccharide export with SLBB domain